MNAVFQLKLKMPKAKLLEDRVAELRREVSKARKHKEDKVKKMNGARPGDGTARGDVKGDLAEEVEMLRRLELNMNLPNLLRTIIDHGIEKLLPAPNETLIAAVTASAAPRGRPVEREVKGKVVR